jgi:hypothetical protein
MCNWKFEVFDLLLMEIQVQQNSDNLEILIM